ncbi:hypothetical protein A2886_00625 [candidate division WWE3 bacterium RIFCSPHIGHO2_01_FULL_42_13]|uniref:ROK family protein n=1 Tax=candidate division WWE3 bacterium RIFCSPHIGHO2_01_FULL_42_13 TaxID=1802617 RepID=A0A1F4UQ87_UNCKA|nr:MAG: hypothetical protein A2886_00625 [candidate division WWE3 bacterium RIFCSPHIGHO2_01_FULL_42_13]
MYISIDLGGTNTRVASSKDLKEIYKIERFLTIPDIEGLRKSVHQAISKVIDGEEVEYVCIGVPGAIDRYERKVLRIPRIPGVKDMPFEEFFGVEKGANLIVENDAALAGLGEAIRGQGKNYRAVAYLTLSTGLGGTLILDKKILNTPRNLEPGRQVILEGGRRFPNREVPKGHFEAYASGSALREFYGVDPETCEDQKVWDEFGRHVASGIINLQALWSPQIVILGGGVSNQFEKFKDAMFKEIEENIVEIPKVVKSDLGDINGVLGGFDLINEMVRKN